MAVVGGAGTVPAAVLLDASVLFPAALRDTLLRSAERGLYRPRWTEEILEEVRRNLIRDLGMTLEQARRPTMRMRQAFPEAPIEGHQPLAATMTNHPKDRHVLAAAVAAGVGTIVTANLRHFPVDALAPSGVRAQSPDEFLSNLLAREPAVILDVLREQAAVLKNPPMSVADVIAAIAQNAPGFPAAVALAMR